MAVIYRHLKPCGEVFYIGIGTEKRAYNKYHRSQFWKDVANKYGYEVQILKRDLSREDASELEILLIAHYGRRNLGKGTLVNLTDGGEYGTTGMVITEGHKQRIRETHLGKKKPKEQVEKRVTSLVNKNLNTTKYICTKTLKTWGTIAPCAEYLGISETTLCRFLNPKISHRNITSIMLYEDYLKYGVIPPDTRGYVIDIITKEIFNNIAEAARSVGMTRDSVARELNRKNKQKNKTSFMLLSEYEDLQKK